MIFYMFIFLSLLFSSIQGQECGEKGTCSVGSELLDTYQEESYADCQLDCANVIECNYFTFYDVATTCHLYSTCDNVLDLGVNCYTSESSCEALVCNKPGSCRGSAFQFNVTYSYDKCLIECKAVELCEWFVYDSASNLCSLHEKCQLSNICATCVVGQKQCEMILRFPMYIYISNISQTSHRPV